MTYSFWRMLGDSRGQGLLEYALIISIVSVAAIAALNFMGSKANDSLANDSLMVPN